MRGSSGASQNERESVGFDAVQSLYRTVPNLVYVTVLRTPGGTAPELT
jgi:hypothetical protein